MYPDLQNVYMYQTMKQYPINMDNLNVSAQNLEVKNTYSITNKEI